MNGLGSLRATLGWVIAFAIVLAVLGFETDWGDGISLPVPVPAASKPKPVDVALMPEYRIDGGLDARRETVERALFNPTRRPAPPAIAEAGGANAKLDKGQYVLTGTTLDGAVAAAVLKEVKTGKSHVVKKGEKIGDLVVAEVTADKVRLELGGQFEELDLKIAGGPKATVQPVVPAPPPGAAAVLGQPAFASEAARLQALRAAELEAERRGRQPQPTFERYPQPTAVPPANAVTGAASMSEILAQRRRAAAAAAAAAAPKQ